jgi:glycolate oxidase iron-sulfur subunit
MPLEMHTPIHVAPKEKLLACVHCGLCLSACPTYVVNGNEADSPRGRIHLMNAIDDGRIGPSADAVRHLDLCLGCRACETACPSGVEYGALIESARHRLEPHVTRTATDRWKRRVLARVLPDVDRLRPVRRVLSTAAMIGVPRLARMRWLPLRLRRLAAMVPERQRAAALAETYEPSGEPRGTVVLVSGCVTRVLFPRLNVATARLLALARYRVIVPQDQVCCGALLAHLGDGDEADRLARKNVNALLRPSPDWIVTNAAGCGAHLRDYGRRLEDDPLYGRAAGEVAAKARDVTELLADAELPTPPKPWVTTRVAYHDACHLAHGQGVRAAPRALLASVPGVQVVEIADSEICCGSAGSYNLTEPEMAWRLADRKARTILDSGADMVAAANPGCILQIRAALRVARRELPVFHPVEIVARAHGLE